MKKFLVLFLILPILAMARPGTQYFDRDTYDFGVGPISKQDLFYLQGTDSNIQDQLDTLDATDADLETRIDAIETDTSLADHEADTTPHATIDGAAITNPARSDVKKDTLANLETYALTASDGQLVYATDDESMYQVINGALEPVGGGGGLGDTDTYFVQDFESAKADDFSVMTGFILDDTAPLKGEVSVTVTHHTSTTYELKQIIPVDEKFRGKNITLKVDGKTSAADGNMIVEVYDETNAAYLVTSEQLAFPDDRSDSHYLSFDVPLTCTSLSYIIKALPEAGSPTTIIDDISAHITKAEVMSTLIQEVDSSIMMDTANGYGSTATKIRRFTNTTDYTGDGIVMQDDAVNSTRFTIQRSGICSITYSDTFTAATYMAISRNAPSTSANATATATQYLLAHTTTTNNQYSETIPWTGWLNAGDVIRAHTDGGTANPFGTHVAKFSIACQSSLKQVNVNKHSKIRIPTSEVRFEGGSTKGSTDTAVVNFTSVAKLSGDAFEINPLGSPAVYGTHVKMKKKGRVSISSSIYAGASGSYYGITRNLTNKLVGTLPVAEEWVSVSSNAPQSPSFTVASWEGDVEVGQVFRLALAATSTIAASAGNVFHITFQEQDIQVSVSNTLPQFTESDSAVQVYGANGFGSPTGTKIRRFSNISENLGTDIVYNDPSLGSPADVGDSFKIMEDGLYDISYADIGTYFAISVDAPSLSTNASATAAQYILAHAVVANNTYTATISAKPYLRKGQVVRAHTDAQAGTVVATGFGPRFTISKVGRPNGSVDVTPFVNIAAYTGEQTKHEGTMSWPVNALCSTVLDSATYANFPVDLQCVPSVSGNLAAHTTAGAIGFKLRNAIAGRKYTLVINWDMFVTGGNATQKYMRLTNGTDNHYFISNSVNSGVSSTTISFSPTMSGNLDYTFQGFDNGGDTYTFRTTIIPATFDIYSFGKSETDQIVARTNEFSTDTTLLDWASSSEYTESTLINAPRGTLLTFSYAGSTNTRVQCTTAPTQTEVDMQLNGLLIYARTYGATSTCAQPAAFAIQIGKDFKGKEITMFKSSGKVTTVLPEFTLYSNNAAKAGLTFKEYDEKTGVLLLDAGHTISTGVGVAHFFAADSSLPTSAYIVANASKTPTLSGISYAAPRVAYLRDQKANTVDGGSAAATTWQARNFNTLDDPSGIVVNASVFTGTGATNTQITLPAGEYHIEGRAPVLATSAHKLRLRTTTGTVLLVGSSEDAAASEVENQDATIRGRVTLTAETTVELQHYTAAARATDGLGKDSSSGEVEIYSEIKITKVK
jgi:hypothetical protein